MDMLGGLAAFVRAAEARSFIAAGRTLGVSASAIGKSIARLEESLGVRLFHRTTRSISLTEEGALFYERCRAALQEIDDARAELSMVQAAPRGRLRVSLPAVGYRFMLPALPAFRERYPEIELDLDFSDRIVDVIDEGFDAVIRSGELADSRLMAKRLGPYRMLTCTSPGYLARHGTPETPLDLADHVCLRYRFRSTGKLQDWLFDGQSAFGGPQASGQAATHAPKQMVLNNIEAVLSAAVHGLGIAYIPDFVARDALAEGQLRLMLDTHATVEGPFSVVWPTSRHMVPRLRAFVDFASEALFRTPGDKPPP